MEPIRPSGPSGPQLGPPPAARGRTAARLKRGSIGGACRNGAGPVAERRAQGLGQPVDRVLHGLRAEVQADLGELARGLDHRAHQLRAARRPARRSGAGGGDGAGRGRGDASAERVLAPAVAPIRSRGERDALLALGFVAGFGLPVAFLRAGPRPARTRSRVGPLPSWPRHACRFAGADGAAEGWRSRRPWASPCVLGHRPHIIPDHEVRRFEPTETGMPLGRNKQRSGTCA